MTWYNDLAAFVEEQQWGYGAILGVDSGECLAACLERNKELRMLGLDLWDSTVEVEQSCRQLCEPYGNRALLLKGDAATIAKGFRIKTFDFALYNCYDAAYTATEYHERILKIWATKVKAQGHIISIDLHRKELLDAFVNVGITGEVRPLIINGKESKQLKYLLLN